MSYIATLWKSILAVSPLIRFDWAEHVGQTHTAYMYSKYKAYSYRSDIYIYIYIQCTFPWL